MSITPARIVRAEALGEALDPPIPIAPAAFPKRVLAEEARAREAAAAVTAEARRQADAIVAEAKLAANGVAAAAAAEARESETAKLAALYLRIRDEDEKRSARDLERTTSLAVVLAERVLGRALSLEPGLIADLARQALAEARGARSAVVTVHPDDADAFASRLVEAGLGGVSVEIRRDGSLARGSLRLHTNLGAIDAELRPQLERLAKALKDG